LRHERFPTAHSWRNAVCAVIVGALKKKGSQMRCAKSFFQRRAGLAHLLPQRVISRVKDAGA
jgi:hypothetical protein